MNTKKNGALIMHKRGAGKDGSIVIQGTSSPRQPGIRLLENMVFICKPCVTTADRAYRLAQHFHATGGPRSFWKIVVIGMSDPHAFTMPSTEDPESFD